MNAPKAKQRGWGTQFTPYTGNVKSAQKPAHKMAPSKSKIGGCTTCGKKK